MNPWSTACLDWEERILSGASLVPELPLFREEADRALRIFKRLRMPDIIGQPTMAEACGPWFFPIVEALFGSYDPDSNRRMVQEFFQVIPKKNAKSSNGGAIMLVALIVNRRPEGEFLFVAPTKEIADIAFKQASATIRADKDLNDAFHIQRHIRLITKKKGGATLQIKAADTDVITGSKALGTMIDETHVFAKKARAADVFVELRGALAARPDGFLFQTTTQSKEPPAGVFKAELTRARAVRDGRIELPLLPIIYELPARLAKDGGWKDRKYWPLVNPNIGRSVDLQFLENQLIAAEEDGPPALALLASQHFNVEIGVALQTDAWPGAQYWSRQAVAPFTLEDLLDRSEVVTVGVDGGGLDDMLGLCAIGREKETRRWLAWFRAWLHKDVLETRKSEASRFLDFQKAGDLYVVDKQDTAFTDVAELVEQVAMSGKLAQVGLDPFGVGMIVDELSMRGISQDSKQVIGIRQGYQLTGAIKTAEVQLADGNLVHGGQPIMPWCVGNAKVELKGNAIVITKQAAGTAKIDPLMAMFNATALMMLNPEATPRLEMAAMVA